MDGPRAAPAAEGPACVAWLDQRLFGRASSLRPQPATIDWLEQEVLARASGPLLGLEAGELDDERFLALRQAGAALAPAGGLRWGVEVLERADLAAPRLQDERLELPPPARLAACDGVQLKPLRVFFGRRLGLRLQSAPRIACYLWADQALLVSCRDEHLAGFLHGPRPDQRHPLAWAPAQPLWLRW